MRAIFEALGVQDVVAKSVGTSNPHNMIKATFAALTQSTSPRAVAARRGKKVSRHPRPPRATERREKRGLRWLTTARQTVTVTRPAARSAAARTSDATLMGLGLNKLHRSARSRTRPSVRGMITQGPAPGARGRGSRSG